MPLVSIPPIVLGQMYANGFASTNVNVGTIDANTEGAGFVFRAPKAGNLKKVGFRCNALTASGTLKLYLVNVSNGFASGSTIYSEDFTISAVGWQWVTLTTAQALVAGQEYGLKLQRDAGTFNGTICTTFTSLLGSNSLGDPHASVQTPTYTTVAGVPIWSIEYDDASQVPMGTHPLDSITSFSLGTGTTPDEIGNRFTLPYRCRVIGGFGRFASGAADQDPILTLYGPTDTVLGSCRYNEHIDGTAGCTYFAYWTPVILEANTVYRIVQKASVAGTGTTSYITVVANSDLKSAPLGENWYRTGRVDAGAWTDVNTSVALIGLIIDQIDSGAASPTLVLV